VRALLGTVLRKRRRRKEEAGKNPKKTLKKNSFLNVSLSLSTRLPSKSPNKQKPKPTVLSGAAQADVGVLVIAARKGEFETGFERGGQTREHAQLAKTLGVAKLVVAVNKMDDPSVVEEDGSWSQSRYDEVLSGLTPFLKACGYNTKRDVVFLPMSGLHGHNIKDSPPSKICPWYKGPTLFGVLDSVEMPARDPLAPFRLSIIDKYRDMGTIVMGKSEAG
jgi:peptide chain release factor subunit 3